MKTEQIKQTISPWVASFPAEIIVCDRIGTILEMNDHAIEIYKQTGGAEMIGRNLYDHHFEPARSQVESVVANRVSQMETVIYTTEKAGEKKLVCIAPWQQAGMYAGFALLTLDLPEKMPNICKD
jgi:transcriptional regulator with PAS, ATPase and Fis domain